METLSEVLEAARLNACRPTWRGLAEDLGITSASMTHLTKGHGLPSDATMLKLAGLAKMDPAEALMLLNYWRQPHGAAKAEYKSLWQRAKSAAVMVLLAMVLTAPAPSKPSAGIKASSPELYIMRLCRRIGRWLRWAAGLHDLLTRPAHAA